jgi:hypothetical protein
MGEAPATAIVSGTPMDATVVCAMSEASPSSVAAEAKMHSPQISALARGKIEVEGAGTFRDAKLFPGGAREWDWRETGTGHTPGVQPADVRELLDHGATTVVLSQGMLKRLRICPETLKLLKQQGVGAYVLPTQDAVDLYNNLRNRARREIGRVEGARARALDQPGRVGAQDPMTDVPRNGAVCTH